MAGSLLGPDQIKKINTLFPVLVAHIKSLLEKDHTGVGLMRVHGMVETFDSDEMARIFKELSFISPKEKLALVRAAVYELVVKVPSLFMAPNGPEPVIMPALTHANKDFPSDKPKTFTPPQFKLNVNAAADFHGQKPEDTPKPEPIVTSTHTSKVSEQLKAGEKEKAAQQKKIDAAVAKLHEASKPIEVMTVPDDASLAIVESVEPEVELPEIKE